MESVGKGRSGGSAVLLLIIGSAISSGFLGQLGEGAVRRVRIVPSSTLISAKVLSRAVHAQKRTKNFHPRASRKKNNSGPKNGSRNVAQKIVKQNNGNTSNPSSSDFLELRNLVTGVAAK